MNVREREERRKYNMSGLVSETDPLSAQMIAKYINVHICYGTGTETAKERETETARERDRKTERDRKRQSVKRARLRK